MKFLKLNIILAVILFAQIASAIVRPTITEKIPKITKTILNESSASSGNLDSIVSSSSLPASKLHEIREHNKLAARDRLRDYIREAIDKDKTETERETARNMIIDFLVAGFAEEIEVFKRFQ